MFEIDNIISFTSQNIQVLGIFVAIIGGIVASRLLGFKVEREVLIERRKRLIDEINFINTEKDEKVTKLYELRRIDFIQSVYRDVYKDILNESFDIKTYHYLGLSKDERERIVHEILELFIKGFEIFKEEHHESEVKSIIENQNIEMDYIDLELLMYVGKKTSIQPEKLPFMYPNINIDDLPHFSSLSNNLNEKKIEDIIDEMSSTAKWKKIELDDVEIRIQSIMKSMNIKNDVSLFLLVTTAGIIVPQFVLSIYPLMKDIICLNYLFALYSIFAFLACMISMLMYVHKLSKQLLSDFNV